MTKHTIKLSDLRNQLEKDRPQYLLPAERKSYLAVTCKGCETQIVTGALPDLTPPSNVIYVDSPITISRDITCPACKATFSYRDEDQHELAVDQD